MTGKTLRRVLACLLAVLLLSQVGAFSPAVFAADDGVQLQSGTVLIPSGASVEDVNRILAQALVVGFDQLSTEEQDAIVTQGFEYYCEGKSSTGLAKNDAWGSVTGFTTTKKVGWTDVTCTHPPLADNADGSYPVRLAGTTAEVTLTKAAKLSSSIVLNEGVSVALSYKEDGTLDFDALRAAIFAQVVESTAPELSVDDVTIEYYATAKSGSAGSLGKAWMPLEGGEKNLLTYPAISAGAHDIRISYAENDTYYGSAPETTVTFVERPKAEIHVKNDQEVSLPYTDATTVDYDALRAKLFTAVVESTTPELTVDDVTIEYYASTPTGLSHDWVALEGAKDGIKEYPAITAGEQKIRFTFGGNGQYAGTSVEVSVQISERPSATWTLKENPTFQLKYTDENGTVAPDLSSIKQQVWDAVVESTDPELSIDNVTIEYYGSAESGTVGSLGHAWVLLTGGKVNGLNYPAISEGTQKVRLSWTGNKDYAPSAKEATVEITGRPEVQVKLKDNPTFKLAFTADGEAIYDSIQQQVFDAVIESTDPELTADNVTIEYYATAKSGSAGSLGKAWMPLEGGEKNLLTYPPIGEGTQQVRISWQGTKDYAPNSVVAAVEVTGRAAAPFQLKEGVTEVAMVYNKDQSINYEATAQALREALLESTDPAVSINDVTVEYNAGTSVIKNYKPLDCSETLVPKFDLGNNTIRFTWKGNADYKAYSAEVTVDVTDNRIVSKIVLKSGASITYNMDASVMEQAIFENLIDWEASELPEKGTLSASDFTFEYYGENVVNVDESSISGGVKQWAPIGGGTVNLLTYPQMGAGENQQVRVTFKGNEAYRPCKNVEGTLTVNKAKVSVKVHTTSIYADEKPGDGFITTDPADKFDIYTIYGGITSDVTTSVFVELPARYTNNLVLTAIDKALELAGQPTLTDMMQNGTTIGQLRKILSDVISQGDNLPTFIKDALKTAGIDIDTLVKINEMLSKLPGLLDNVRVAFGTPDQAGVYVVTAVTNNKNYETGVGTGMLLVKKHYSGVKLEWNETIPNGKLTVEEAAEFDFGVTLTYNGERAVKQDNVHYLYSGFTSKWKPYSSTTTPPTEPGRYIVTVVTLGGNYQAAPITRAFQITK